MSNPANSTVQNLLPVQAYFSVDGEFQTFIGQGQPFTATIGPDQSGLHITNSTIDSTTIGATTPSTGVFTSGQVLATPSGNTDIANKLYVDSVASGLSWKAPFQVATTANLTSRAGLLEIDGYQTVAGDRVLVKNQSTSSQNGIYIASAGTWAYAPDGDTWSEYISAIGFVEYGSQAGSAWYCPAQAGGTLGTTAMTWSNFSVAGTYFAGTGLTLAAYTFSITDTGVTAATYGSASSVPVVAVNAQGQITSATNTTIAISNTQVSGLGTMSTQNANSVAITGGTIDGTPVGATTAAAVTGTTITAGTQFTGPGTGLTGTASSLSIGGNAATATSATSATTATNLAGGSTGSLPYQSAANTTALLAAGTNGQILTLAAGVPSWANAPSSMVYPGAGIPNSTGSAWGTSYSTTGTGTVVALATSPSLSSPTIDGANPYISFADGTAVTVAAGKLWYNGTTGSWNAGMGGGNITQQIGEELFIYGKASSAITEGQLIMKTGVVGASGVITFAPTSANLTDDQVIIGVATENIPLNGFGRITAFGVVHGIDLSAFADGDILWYDPTSSTGGMTATKPTAPNVKCEIGIVINAGSGGSGSMQVEIIHGTSLGGTDSNVNITSATGGNLLSYDQTAGYWKNINLTAGSNVTITPATNGAITIAAAGGLTVTDDTSTNATRYLTFTDATSGSITGINTSSTKLQYNPSTGALTIPGVLNATSGIIDASANTGALNIPSGTSAQRPGSPTTGAIRWNTTYGTFEVYSNSGTLWQKVGLADYAYTVQYLIVGGGGGGGTESTGVGVGGGGAGGFLTGNYIMSIGTTYSFVVGGGGGGQTYARGLNGSDSTGLGLTAIGGGGGGFGNGSNSGGSGGSGGGGANGGAGGSGTAGQGNNGGSTSANNGGSGGGANAGGGQNTSGGAGKVNPITGSTSGQLSGGSYYLGGGGGCVDGANNLYSGGIGGGGSPSGPYSPGNGAVNTGGGAGGHFPYGGTGGSGVIVISIPTVSYSGTTTGSPTVIVSGSNTILQFNSSGSYTA